MHGQWIMNRLLLEFRPEHECWRLIEGDTAKSLQDLIQFRKGVVTESQHRAEMTRISLSSKMVSS